MSMTQEEINDALEGYDAMMKVFSPPPTCHFTPMEYNEADDGDCEVHWFECKHCGCQKGLGGDYLGNAND